MNIFQQAFDFWEANGTKILGGLVSIDTTLLGVKAQYPDIFSSTITTWLAAIGLGLGLWTGKRGVYNTSQIAQKVVDKQVAAGLPTSPPGTPP